MAFDLHRVRVQRPCPSKSAADEADPDATSFHCDSCDKSVHVLSNITGAEAAALLGGLDGQSICVRYRTDSKGRIYFAVEDTAALVPVTALASPRGAHHRLSAVAAVGFSAALAACTPHVRAEPRPRAVSGLEELEAQSPAPLVRDTVVTPVEQLASDRSAYDTLADKAQLEKDLEAPGAASCDGKPRRKKINVGPGEMGLMGL